MSGRVGGLSDNQAAILSEFREKVADVLDDEHDDIYLLRWLRARSFDIKKAESMLRENLKWRKQIGADEIDSWQPPEVLLKYYPGGLHGFDKEGSPIWIEPYGYGDIKGLLHSVKKSDLLKFKVSHCETIARLFGTQSRKLDRLVDEIGLVIIFDLQHYGLKHLWKPAVSVQIDILAMFEAYYPETLKTTFIVNAPRIFPIAYNIFKPFLSEDTRKKVVVLGRSWKVDLLKYIDADQLPKQWGGSATDPDGNVFCQTKVNMGGEVPAEFYLQKDDFVDMSNFTTVTVGKGTSKQVICDITKADSILRWQFWTQDKDLGFGLFLYKGKDTSKTNIKKSDMEVLIPIVRVNCHLVPEDGSHCCSTPGQYVLVFDNSFSWMASKKLSYQVETFDENEAGDLKISPSFYNDESRDNLMSAPQT